MRTGCRSIVLAAGLAASWLARASLAADVTWDNGASNFQWNFSPNWNGSPWNNAVGDGAVFGPTGVGAISVGGFANVDSLDFQVDGYSIAGSTINFVSGFSTQTTGVVNTAPVANIKISSPITSAVGFQKIGPGVLEISGTGNYTGGIPLTVNGRLSADVLVGGTNGTISGGTLRVMNQAALPMNSRVSIGTGYLDIQDNITISRLMFTNQNVAAPWNTTLNANNGVIGSGTLRVIGEINVIGVTALSAGNSIAANVDLGGGEQVVRCGIISQIGLQSALMFTGNLSNGSLVKTIGFTQAGTFGSVDGISLHGNHTYTGQTVLNSGSSVASGTNQSTSIKVHGAPAGPAGASFSLLGANGAFPAVTTIQVSAGSNFILDNNTTIAPTAFTQPNIPAAQNNNRINDNAAITLREGNFVYRGLTATIGGETFGSVSAVAGHNVITLTPNGGGSVTLTGTGNLTLGNRATLYVNATGAGNTLGGNAQLKFNGTLPPLDSTGIFTRIASTTDFLTYNAGTGFTPFTGYTPNFLTSGANVSLAASATAPTVTINALRTGAAVTTTIAAADTLSITSGMILSASGTGTLTGGKIEFGNTPGVLFGGMNIASALSGTQGFIHATGTGTLSGDLSGLSGTLSTHGATTNLNTNTFANAIHVRQGTLNVNVSQTGAGFDPIYLGVPENESDLTGTIPTLAFSGAGANAIIDRPIVVDNGSQSAKGVALSFSLATRLSPLSNNTGSQTLNGDITLLSDVNLQGSGGGGAGATVFTGDVSGTGRFIIPNGRVIFTGTSNNSNAGGFLLGNQGFTAQVTFAGTSTGSGTVTFNGGNNMILAYANGSLPSGTISVVNAAASTAVTITPTNDSVLSNRISLQGEAIANVDSGIVAEWAGPIGGSSRLRKNGDGELKITNFGSPYEGLIEVNAGLLRVNGGMPNADVTVNAGGTLAGTGLVENTSVLAGGTLAPGASIGTLRTGNTSLFGSYSVEIDLDGGSAIPATDLLRVIGDLSLGGSLDLSVANFNGSGARTFIIISNDEFDLTSGTFANITGVPSGFTATVNYGFSGTDALGRMGSGNDVAITLIPEPASIAGFGVATLMLVRRRRR